MLAQAKECTKVQKEEIQPNMVIDFKSSNNCNNKLRDYKAYSYIICIDNMIKLLIEKGVEATIPILIKVKKSFALLEAVSKSTQVMALKLGIGSSPPLPPKMNTTNLLEISTIIVNRIENQDMKEGVIPLKNNSYLSKFLVWCSYSVFLF